ncbi:hypothetical protein GOODEAATRI_012198, partial [Goodea atripinnis]
SNVLQSPEFSIVIGGGASPGFSRTEKESSPQRSQKPQVVYRTIFHTRVNQDQVQPKNPEQVDLPHGWSTLSHPPSSSPGLNGEVTELQENQAGGEAKDCYEERACTLGRMRSVPRNVLDLQLSKSLSKSDSNLVAVSPIQIDKIMSSIGAGIGSGLDVKKITSGPRCPLQSIGQWLDSIGLVQYENHLLANGFDNVQFMGSNVVEDQDLLEIGILSSAHRQRLLQAIRLLPRVSFTHS